MRTGVAIGELRQLRLDLQRAEAAPLTQVLGGVGDHYRAMDPDALRVCVGALELPPPDALRLLSHVQPPAVAREGGVGVPCAAEEKELHERREGVDAEQRAEETRRRHPQ